jgi:hypothetical protein
MTSSEKYCMRVDDFHANLVTSLSELKESEEFFDVTLVSDDETPFKAHKVILSASSPFFRKVLKFNQSTSPLLYIRGLTSRDLANVVEFLYKGEVTVAQEDLDKFLKVSKDLKLKGMYENEEVDLFEWTSVDSVENKKKEEVKKGKTENQRKTVVKLEDNIMEGEVDVQVADSSKDTDNTTADDSTFYEQNNIDEDYDAKLSEMMFKEDRMWHCKKCGENKNKKSNIKLHIEIHHLDVSQRCKLCDVVSKNKPSMYYHMRKKHSIN